MFVLIGENPQLFTKFLYITHLPLLTMTSELAEMWAHTGTHIFFFTFPPTNVQIPFSFLSSYQ